MGVERSVTRWYLRRQLILTEIAHLEARLAPSSVPTADEASGDAVREDTTKGDLENLRLQLTLAQEGLKALGHCPRPMMG
jgi:hypothetical protein